MRVLLACCALLLGASYPAAGQQSALPPDTTVLDLAELLAEVQANNPSLRAARLHAEALQQRQPQVSALPDPTVMAGYRPFAVGGVDGVLPAGIRLEQMVPYPGKRRLAGEAAAFGAEAASHTAEALMLDLVYQTKDAYYELVRIQEQARLIKYFQQQLAAFEDVATVRYEVGTGMQQAILKAQLERNRLTRHRLELAAMQRTLLERLARLTNRPTLAAQHEIVFLRPALGLEATTSPETALPALPDADALRAEMQEAESEIALARKAYRPDFMIGVGFMDMMTMGNDVAPLDNLGRRLGVEVGVVIPLQRGSRHAALEEARLRRAMIDARYEALQTEIETEYNSLRNRLEEDQKALALYTGTLIPQAETSLEATLSAYTTGRTDFLDLLDAERMLFDLQMDYEETYASYVKTRAALERVLGLPSYDAVDAQLVPLVPANSDYASQDR